MSKNLVHTFFLCAFSFSSFSFCGFLWMFDACNAMLAGWREVHWTMVICVYCIVELAVNQSLFYIFLACFAAAVLLLRCQFRTSEVCHRANTSMIVRRTKYGPEPGEDLTAQDVPADIFKFNTLSIPAFSPCVALLSLNRVIK